MGEKRTASGRVERRPASRFLLRAPTEFRGRVSGKGTTFNLSSSGVLIEDVSHRVPLGALVKMRFSFFAGSFDADFRGRVVRITESGFAAQFAALEATHREVLRRALPPAAAPEGPTRAS